MVWKIRSNRNVAGVYQEILGLEKLEDLIVSYDRACIQRPPERKMPDKMWLHLDQDFHTKGLRCIQGFVTLEDCEEKDGTLIVVPGSHKFHNEFFEAFPERKETKGNWVKFSETEVNWWTNKGLAPIRVAAPKGSLVLWDSRSVHCNCYAQSDRENKDRFRYAIYVCYARRQDSTPKLLKRKREVFEAHRTTSHWPLANFKQFPEKPQWCQNQQEEPPTSLKVRTREDLKKISRGYRAAHILPLIPCVLVIS